MLENEYGTFEDNKITGETAKQVFERWLANKDKIVQTPGETLTKELANIKIDNMKKDVMMTNALQTIASLKVQVMNLKGGTV